MAFGGVPKITIMEKKLALDLYFFTMGLASTGCLVFIDTVDDTFQAGGALLLTRKENL